MPRDHGRRPGAGAASSVVADTSQDTRCALCGARVWSARSIETGLGQDCRRRLTRMLTTGAEVRETTRQKPVTADSAPSRVPVDLGAVRAAVVALRAAADALDVIAGGGR